MPRHTVDGAKLRALRVSTGVHMRDVAAAAGCSWRHLQMIETGQPAQTRAAASASGPRQPSPELLARLLKVLSKHLGRTVDVAEVLADEPAGQPVAAGAA